MAYKTVTLKLGYIYIHVYKLTGQAKETLKSNLLDISTVMQHQFCSTCILLKIRINQSTTMQRNPMIIKQPADKSEIQQVTPRQSMLLMPYSVHIVPSLGVAEIKPRISTREDHRLYCTLILYFWILVMNINRKKSKIKANPQRIKRFKEVPPPTWKAVSFSRFDK